MKNDIKKITNLKTREVSGCNPGSVTEVNVGCPLYASGGSGNYTTLPESYVGKVFVPHDSSTGQCAYGNYAYSCKLKVKDNVTGETAERTINCSVDIRYICSDP